MGNLKQEIVKGTIWSGVQRYSGMVVSLVVSAVLARLLSPEEFGVVAIANVLIWFFSMFATMGIGPAIIQRKDLTQNDLNNIFTFSFLVGICFSLLFYLSSWIIASWYDNRELVPVCQLLSLTLFLSTINMVPGALMAKNLRFKESAIITLILQLVTGVISVIAAYKGFGVYALLISPILAPIGSFIYNNRFYPVHLSRNLCLEPIRKIFSFSMYQFLFELFNYFSRNLDKIVIGKYISMADLGYYEKSYRLMQLPIQNVTSVINPVLQPVLSSLQDNPTEIGHKYCKLIKFIAAISFPLTVIIYVCGYEVIHLFYGANWDDAVPTFKILSLSVCMQMILSTSGAIFMASNNTKAQFWVGVRNTFTTVIGFIVAAYFFKTIEAIAWSWVITLFINFVCTYYIMYRFVLKTSILPLLHVFLHPLLNVLVLVVAGLLITHFIVVENDFVRLMIKGTSLFVLSILYIQVSGQYDIIKAVKSKLK